MKKIFPFSVINIIMFFYILSLYIFTFRQEMTVYSNALALLLILSVWFNFLVNKRKIVFNIFLFIYLLFIGMCLFSTLYALSNKIAADKCKTLLLLFILLFSLVNYLDSLEKIKKVMAYFVYSGFIASIYIFVNSDFSQITRYGTELGNVNAIGMIISISVIFCFYFILYGKKYWYAVFMTSMIPCVLLTGSRKSLLFIIINIILILYLNNRRSFRNKLKLLIIGILILAGSYYAIFKIPFLYKIIGVRMENLFDFISGKGTREGSINERAYMIKFGIEMFKKRPLIGYGIDNYRVLLGDYYGIMTYAHNNLVELLADTGIFGALIYYLMNIIVLIQLFISSEGSIIKNMYYVFISILIVYILLSSSLIYYDNKHFIFILALSSAVNEINRKAACRLKNNYVQKEETKNV